MIADPEGPSFITRTVGRRRYADDASVSHDPALDIVAVLTPAGCLSAVIGTFFCATANGTGTHSMTSSTRTRSDAGIVRPKVRAVLLLMTVSNSDRLFDRQISRLGSFQYLVDVPSCTEPHVIDVPVRRKEDRQPQHILAIRRLLVAERQQSSEQPVVGWDTSPLRRAPRLRRDALRLPIGAHYRTQQTRELPMTPTSNRLAEPPLVPHAEYV